MRGIFSIDLFANRMDRKLRRNLIILLLSLTAIFVGCAPPPAYHRPLEPVADRLRKAYPDLAAGRFQVIADFESLDQGAIFRVAPPTAAAFIGIVTEKAKAETGAACLKLRLTSPDQTLVIEDTDAGQWTLPRDWRAFQLLLLSVYTPRTIGGINFTARSGVAKASEYHLGGLALREGWNLLRIDVGDIGEQIDLADIRQLRFNFDRFSEPVELYIDDIILSDNSKNLLSSPGGQPGELYCRTEGRRIRIGAIERYELVFNRGRIVQWFDLRNDPNRIRNLAGGGPIGPIPVNLPKEPDAAPEIEENTLLPLLGNTAEVTQGVAEATPVRVIVWGQWRIGDKPPLGAMASENASQRWIYTLYATGKVYLQMSGHLSTDAATTASSTGYVVSCASSEGFERHLPLNPKTDSPDMTIKTGYVLYQRTEQNLPDCLFAFYSPTVAPLARPLRHGELTRMGTLFYGGNEYSTDWAALLNVWPGDMDDVKISEAMIRDYRRPLPVTLNAGRLVKTDPGDIDGDGYNESRGHYTLETDGNVIKVRIDGRARPYFAPAFKIVDVGERDLWAYVDGFELHSIARDLDKNAVFQIPQIVESEMLIEVVTRPHAASQPAQTNRK